MFSMSFLPSLFDFISFKTTVFSKNVGDIGNAVKSLLNNF